MTNNMLGQRTYGNPQTAYKNTAVQTATPEKLLVMLYTGEIKFLRQGQKAIENKNYEEAHNSLKKAQDIISELNITLNMEKGGEIAVNLRQLYNFYYGEVLKANLKKEASFLKPVVAFFESYRDIWIETAKLARMGAK